MKVAGLVLALATSATAFTSTSRKSSSALSMGKIDDMAGSTMPFKTFDPLGLATLGSDTTLAWFRAAELKHSRVAMLATTGYIVQAAGAHFPGMLSKDVSFASLSTMKPFDAWDAVPEAGKIWNSSFVTMSWIYVLFHLMKLSQFSFPPKRQATNHWIDLPRRNYLRIQRNPLH